jgi:hypothetical protein
MPGQLNIKVRKVDQDKPRNATYVTLKEVVDSWLYKKEIEKERQQKGEPITVDLALDDKENVYR